jgi:hypothetical protein
MITFSVGFIIESYLYCLIILLVSILIENKSGVMIGVIITTMVTINNFYLIGKIVNIY